MAIEYPVKITYTNDKASLKKSQKEVKKGAKSSSKTGMGTIAGGVAIGGLLSKMLGSLDSITKLLDVVGSALNAFVAPFIPVLLTLLKPFLGLFLLVGSLLIKWLKSTFMDRGGGLTTTDDKGQTKLGNLGAIITMVTASIATVVALIVAGFGGLPAIVIGLIAVAVGSFATYLVDAGARWSKQLSDWLANKIVEWGDALADFIIYLGDKWTSFVDWVSNILDNFVSWLSETFNKTISNLSYILNVIWNSLKNTFIASFQVLKGFGKWIWDSLVGIFTKSWEVLKNFGQKIWDSLVNILSSSFNVLSNIGSWIWRKITSFFSFGSKRHKSVNDAVITPTGQVVHTNPNDYLVATKNPSMVGSGTNNITININGNADRNTIDEIVRRLQQELRVRGSY